MPCMLLGEENILFERPDFQLLPIFINFVWELRDETIFAMCWHNLESP